MPGRRLTPVRWTEVEAPSQSRIALVSYSTALPPDVLQAQNPLSLIRERRANLHVPVAVLSGTAGYIDSVGFLLVAGLFPAHVTGEIVGLTKSLAGGHPLSHPSRWAVLPIFIAALFVAAAVVRRERSRQASPRRALLGLMALSLGFGACTGFWGVGETAAVPEWVLAVREAGLVSAMAFQNAFTREGLARSCPTTVMTGNLTQFVFELVDAFCSRMGWNRSEDTHARNIAVTRLDLVGKALASFVCGAVLGGYMAGFVGAFSVVIPMLAAIWLSFRFKRDRR
ncbi:MAG TPA: YoaK family protein [Polyangiaceae bacterium]|jgi:uncharacterized membrane protein YoaK (UPF0700 family)|nr:YoaK family protein [Polyangiaceae bacterium]